MGSKPLASSPTTPTVRVPVKLVVEVGVIRYQSVETAVVSDPVAVNSVDCVAAKPRVYAEARV